VLTRRSAAAGLLILLAGTFAGILSWPPVVRPQAPSSTRGVDVMLNVLRTGAKKLNVMIPDFTLLAGTDSQGLSKRTPEVMARDLAFTALFSVVTGEPAVPAGNMAALRELWGKAAAAGAEVRLYDLTTQDYPLIGSQKLDLPAGQARRLAHRLADWVVFQYTGEWGVADTKIAYAGSAPGNKELYWMDYDGFGAARLTANGTINLSPSWSPDVRSVAFMSYMGIGYPYVYRLFPFEPNRPAQLLAGWATLNTTPAWSPDGRSVAFTSNKDGNPDVYVLALATGAVRRLTTHHGIDTEPTWSPTGREIAFVSDRGGSRQIFVMDADGANVRRLTQQGLNTQPRWSPKGDWIAFTSLQGNHDIWVVSPDGSTTRRLTAGPGSNESAAWAPNGRHLVFQSNRLGGFELFTMLADGSEQQPLTRGPGEATSAAWSPRLP
jgi:TolB protein